MAVMWPRAIPPEIRADRRRRAEIEVFGRLEADLDNSWYAFYSRPWWGLSDRGGELDGEADFIVAHPDRGMLFIEVKGGGVRFDGDNGKWTSTDGLGVTHRIKDPVSQAMVCKHRFEKKLRELPGWPAAPVRLRHGVVFPDSADPGSGVSTIAGSPKMLFCFEREFDQALGSWIEARLAPHESRGEQTEAIPGAAGVEALRKLVADPVMLRVPLRRTLTAESAQIEELATHQQMFVLTILDPEPRVLISGGAGTGKTILAMEMAIRSPANCEVCLVCYNEPLATWMSALVGARSNVRVTTFHKLCRALVIEAGLQTAEFDRPGPEFYEKHLPELAKQSLLRMPDRRWDTVIVDEGQDFQPEWWSLVETLVRPGDAGRLRVMYDANQAVYHDRSDPSKSLSGRVFPLRLNLRNTQAIARVTEPLYSGPPVQAIGPAGEPPASTPAVPMEMAVELSIELIARLINEEGLSSDDLAILLPDRLLCARMEKALGQLRLRTVGAGQPRQGAVVVDTIRRFKGLEAVVVLLVVDRISADHQELCYVAVSRARSRLFVIGDVAGTRLERALQAGSSTPAGEATA